MLTRIEGCTSPMTWQFARTLEPDPCHVSAVRHDIGAALRQWGIDGLVDDAQLLVSEVFTNAVQHAAGCSDVTVLMTWTRPILHVEVHDGDPTPLPAAVPPDPSTSVSGRGLPLVDALSSAWGCCPVQPEGKYVWFQLRSSPV